MSEPVVKNAADTKQVKNASRIEKDRAKRFGSVLKTTMQLPEGRALLWALIGRAKVNASIFHRDAAVMAYNSGRQDFGHELMAEIIAADPKLYLLMENEARSRDAREDAAVDASHIDSADETRETT